MFVGALEKLQMAAVSFIMSVWNDSIPTGWIFVKFDIGGLFENC
jgi:hypothetical protein